MNINQMKTVATLALLSLLTSCGSELGGGASEFNSVFVTSTVASSEINADIAAHKAPPDFCTSTDFVTIPAADQATVDIKLNIYPGVTNTALLSPIEIKQATITYVPNSTTNGTPAIPTQYQPLSVTIDPGASASIPVNVARMEIKQSLFNALACQAPIFTYYVTIKFDAVEIKTGKTASFSNQLTVRFADWVDK